MKSLMIEMEAILHAVETEGDKLIMIKKNRKVKTNTNKMSNERDYQLAQDGWDYYNRAQSDQAHSNPSERFSNCLKAVKCFEKIQFNNLDAEFRGAVRIAYAGACNDLLIYYQLPEAEDNPKARVYGIKGIKQLELVTKEWISELGSNSKKESQISDDFATILKQCPIKLCRLYFNLGNYYFRQGRIEDALDNYINGSQLNHIPSTYNVALIYAAENSPLYDPDLAEEYTIKAADIEINVDEEINLTRTQMVSCFASSDAGRIMIERKQYDKALAYYESAINYQWLDTKSREYLQNQKDTINKLKHEQNDFTEKHDYVLSLFSNKAKGHLQREDYMQIETSLIVYDFLSNTGNDQLDYSSAIMPILKCVENLLHPIFAVDYLNYLWSLPEIDVTNIPRAFLRRDGMHLRECVDRMDYGNVIYCCTNTPKYIDNMTGMHIIVPYFIDFLNQRGVIDAKSKSDAFVKGLIKLKDRYRNPAAHGIRVSQESARGCLDYLLDTIKFINQFLNDFYVE